MNKQYLINVATAKESLNIWLSNLEQKHRGNRMFSKENDTDRKNTDFYKWYYGEGQTFSSFETFRDIESHYHKMHDHFLAYNTLSKTPIKKSWFSNKTDKRKTELNLIYKKIEFSSNILFDHITSFENKLFESPLFDHISKPDTSEVEEIFEDKTEEIFNIDDSINPISDTKPSNEDSNNIIETADDNKEEEFLPILVKKPLDNRINTLIEFDTDDEVVPEEVAQDEEKKAILEIPKKELKQNQIKDNNKILTEIDIEEEIRRILS